MEPINYRRIAQVLSVLMIAFSLTILIDAAWADTSADISIQDKVIEGQQITVHVSDAIPGDVVSVKFFENGYRSYDMYEATVFENGNTSIAFDTKTMYVTNDQRAHLINPAQNTVVVEVSINDMIFTEKTVKVIPLR